jgi:hypothetical protein
MCNMPYRPVEFWQESKTEAGDIYNDSADGWRALSAQHGAQMFNKD